MQYRCSALPSPGHKQNWIYGDVIKLHKMAPTLRDAIRGHISALFSALKCSFPTVLWELITLHQYITGHEFESPSSLTFFNCDGQSYLVTLLSRSRTNKQLQTAQLT